MAKSKQHRGAFAFRKTLLFFLLLSAAIGYYLYSTLSRYGDADIIAYQKLYENEELTPQYEGSYVTLAARCAWVCQGEEDLGLISRQQRNRLQKEFYFRNQDKPLHLKIVSDQALLAFERHNGMLDAIEHMKKAVGIMQQQTLVMLPDGRTAPSLEELLALDKVQIADLGTSFPVQRIVRLYANEATYHYQGGLFNGEKVKFEYVLAPTHQFDENLPIFTQDPAGFEITAPYATYRNDEPTEINPPSKSGILGSFSGKLLMHSNLESEPCTLCSKVGDEIHASEVEIDSTDYTITMQHPVGKIGRIDGKPPITFKGQQLLWEDLKNTLTLSKDVTIQQEGIGKITSTGDVVMTTENLKESKQLKNLVSTGETTLNLTEEGNERSLHTKGLLKIDHDKMEARIFGLANDDGIVLDGEQVFFNDSKGEIFADRALVKYAIVDGKPAPNKIVLLGDVKIINRLPSPSSPLVPVLQHILAERVDFFPETNEMLFTAEPGKRVLLLDKKNNFQVSAPSIKIVRDQAANKETVQGLGDVRFKLLKNEYEELKKRFALDAYYKSRSSSHAEQ